MFMNKESCWKSMLHAAVGVYCSVMIAMSGGCKAKAVAKPEAPATPVTTSKSIAKDIPLYLQLPGTTTSIQVVQINARVEGWLDERLFEQGADVDEGDMLYVIDPEPFELALQQSQADLISSEAQLAYARREFERNIPLVESGAISREAFDQLLTQLEQAEALVVQNEAAVADAELNLGYCFIESPMDGRIGRTIVNEGNLVGPGINTMLAEIVQLDPMYIEFYPPANRLPMIRNSLAKEGKIPVQVSLVENDTEGQASISRSMLTTRTFNGDLTFIDNVVDPTTSTFLARATIDNKDGLMLPGQYGNVQLRLEIIEDAVMVPTQAIAQQPGSFYVWTIASGNTAKITPVQLGAAMGNMQHVTKGLKAGEVVITEGLTELRSGEKVSATEAKPKSTEDAGQKKSNG